MLGDLKKYYECINLLQKMGNNLLEMLKLNVWLLLSKTSHLTCEERNSNFKLHFVGQRCWMILRL